MIDHRINENRQEENDRRYAEEQFHPAAACMGMVMAVSPVVMIILLDGRSIRVQNLLHTSHVDPVGEHHFAAIVKDPGSFPVIKLIDLLFHFPRAVAAG